MASVGYGFRRLCLATDIGQKHEFLPCASVKTRISHHYGASPGTPCPSRPPATLTWPPQTLAHGNNSLEDPPASDTGRYVSDTLPDTCV